MSFDMPDWADSGWRRFPEVIDGWQSIHIICQQVCSLMDFYKIQFSKSADVQLLSLFLSHTHIPSLLNHSLTAFLSSYCWIPFFDGVKCDHEGCPFRLFKGSLCNRCWQREIGWQKCYWGRKKRQRLCRSATEACTAPAELCKGPVSFWLHSLKASHSHSTTAASIFFGKRWWQRRWFQTWSSTQTLQWFHFFLSRDVNFLSSCASRPGQHLPNVLIGARRKQVLLTTQDSSFRKVPLDFTNKTHITDGPVWFSDLKWYVLISQLQEHEIEFGIGGIQHAVPPQYSNTLDRKIYAYYWSMFTMIILIYIHGLMQMNGA